MAHVNSITGTRDKGLQNLTISYCLSLTRISKSDLFVDFRPLSTAFIYFDFLLSRKSVRFTTALFVLRCC